MQEAFVLSIEQQFKLQAIQIDASKASKEQLEQFVVEITRQMMIKDNLIRNLLKNEVIKT